MKKMHKLFSMLLAVAMLLSSVVALAEAPTAEMYFLKVGDFVVSMDGEEMVDLTGLNIELGAGATDTGAPVVIANVNGGETTAASAQLVVTDEGKLVANLDGLSKTFTLDLAALMTPENIQKAMDMLAEMFTEEELAALGAMYTAIMTMTSEDGLVAIETAYADYMAEIEGLLIDKLAVAEASYSFVMGEDAEVPATEITLTMDGALMNAVLEAAVKFYDNVPGVLDMINAALALEGEGPVTSYGDLMEMEEVEAVLQDMSINLAVYESEDAVYTDVMMNIMAGDEVAGSFVLGMAAAEDNLSGVLVADVDGVELQGEMAVANGEIAAHLAMVEGEETTELATLWIGPDETYGTLGSIVFMPADEDEAFGFAYGVSDEQVVINIYDAYTNIEAGGSDNGDGSFKLFAKVEEDGTTTEISLNAGLVVEEIDASFINELAAAEEINIVDLVNGTANEEDLAALENELMPIAMSALGALGQNVPGLAELLGM